MNQTMLGLGIMACLGLLMYSTVLGVIGEAYALQRRVGVTFFFFLSVTAQAILTLQIGTLVRNRSAAVSRGTFRMLAGLCFSVVTIGSASLLIPFLRDDYDDAVAWTATLLIFLHFLMTGRAWRESGFGAEFAVAPR